MDKPFLKGMLTGLLVGSIASVILMPESGRQVADKVRQKTKDFRRRLKEKSDRLDLLDEEVSGLVDSLKETVKMTKNDSEKLKEQLIEFLKERE